MLGCSRFEMFLQALALNWKDLLILGFQKVFLGRFVIV